MKQATPTNWLNRLSIRTKILVLMSVAGFVAIAISSQISNSYLDDELANRVRLRSQLLARSTALSAESLGDLKDLQRVVQALSAESEVLSIMVIDGQRNQVIASNVHERIGRNCDDLFDESIYALVSAATEDDVESYRWDSQRAEGTFVVPCGPRLGGVQVDSGVVLVTLDSTHLIDDVQAGRSRSLRAQVGIITLLVVVVYLLLEVLVARPARDLQTRALKRWRDPSFDFSEDNDELDQLETMLHRAEQRIDEAIVDLERLNWAVDESTVVLTCDESGKIVSVNRRFEQLVGWSNQELVGSYPPVADGEVLREIRSAIRRGEVWRGELLLDVGNDSSQDSSFEGPNPLWLDATIVPIQTDLSLRHAMWIGVDISARRAAESREAALRQSTDAIIDTALDAVITFDPYGRVTAWNEQAQAIFGRSRDAAIGSNIVELIIPARHRQAFAAGIYRFLGVDGRSSVGTRIETEGMRADGSEFPVELSISSVKIDGQRVFATFARDISQRKQHQLEILRARDQAQAASRAKSEFLANMSHELRTPLTAILGYAEILEEDAKGATSEHREAISTIHRNGTHLLGLINDVLDLSKIEAGKLTLGLEPTDVCSVVREVVESLEFRAKAKGIECFWTRDDLIPEWILTDPTRLRQILINLIGNAIKFTEMGRVSIHVGTRVDLALEMAMLEFTIADTGIGMTEAQTQRLFAPFEQVDSSAGRRFGGTGLGLAISHRLSQLLGGQISVTSQLEQGSHFTLTIPAVETDRPNKLLAPPVASTIESCAIVDRELRALETPSSIAADRPLSGLNVLLVEDGPDNQRLISFVLRKFGANVSIANDGVEALEKFGLASHQNDSDSTAPLGNVFDRRRASNASDEVYERRRKSDQPTDDFDPNLAMAQSTTCDVNEPFDLVLTDIQMPRLDGYSLMTLLRAAGCHIPIVALTAHAMNGERERCLTAGCDGYATKPIDRAQLLETCRSAIAIAARRIESGAWQTQTPQV